MGCAKKQGQYSSLEWIPLRYMKLTVVIVLRLLTQQKEQIIHGGGWLEIHKKSEIISWDLVPSHAP